LQIPKLSTGSLQPFGGGAHRAFRLPCLVCDDRNLAPVDPGLFLVGLSRLM
jgi:hypothetical protein